MMNFNQNNIPNFQNIQNIPNMQNMQNQFNNLDEINLEELRRPYKEKIKKLEKELEEKQEEIDQLKLKLLQNNNSKKSKQQIMNNMGNQMNNQFNNFNQINNNFHPINNNMNQMNMVNGPMNNQFNPNHMMNIPNNPMNNNMMNPMFQMCNLMNFNNNIPPMMKSRKDDNRKNSKFLKLTVKGQNISPILIQCSSDEKMEDVINKITTRARFIKENYEFIISRYPKKDSTIEENGIFDESDFIYVIPKSQKEINKIREEKRNNNNFNQEKTKSNSNISILGTKINLQFKPTIGSYIVIQIGLNNTCRDAEVKYCQSLDIPSSLIGKSLKFLYNSQELIPDKKIGQSNLNNLSEITVLDLYWIIGA